MDCATAGDGGSEGDKTKTPEGEAKTKRKMKTASQLEILEKTYSVEAYPSEAVRAELSVQLGLSDRQLQMWFCHRRLKDRKLQPGKNVRKDSPVLGGEERLMVAPEVGSEHLSVSAMSFSPFGHVMDPRKIVGRTPGVAVPRLSSDVQAIKRYYEPQQSVAELKAITFVEAQLGERLREDGPVLGMEFDPLPPDAFGAPIGSTSVGQQKLSQTFDADLYDRSDVKPIKSTTRPLHEYQFIPQQPTARSDTYERGAPSYQYSSPVEGPSAKTLSSLRPVILANEQGPSAYGFQSHVPSLSFVPQEVRQSHLLPSVALEYETVPRKSSLTNIGTDSEFSAHPSTSLDNPFLPTDRRGAHDEDVLRMERKRKSEEARIAREVEAHEKRIRKELEKQDILRRKREEQLKKDVERLDRERKKEEERLLREKQREEERYQREQRRELERREKFLQKETIRAEKMRQKEELRREKEAARQKAATERAIARRLAKESMELLEDERLELMELAASSKGLSSMTSLDYETLQNLDVFRDKLTEFPPKSLLLKKPFAIQPWKDSEENVGNLLMVWRFLITFVDVLGLWPFTLDEFIQAFHDYDPRLLSEVHIALLRSIIKDIEDVARTPATGFGANQNGAANPGGGHPQIVEGAYAWGFDIRSWQCHLNPLTWPEILRQFGLSAGFGPQLKKKNSEQAHLRDDNEVNVGEDAVMNLRNGAAVENAFAIMQERGFSNPRRSRHRLTPGTVKYAAFHVLSLEGNHGLTILEVADKIQKSGLRDLTTSKTPEASIAAALSRDSKLFERTAPSTYCVRTAYRKDPADAEAILSAAGEKIRIFKSGFVDGDYTEDAERDDDSGSDVAEDPEIDDLGAELNPKKEAHNSPEANQVSITVLGNGKEDDGVTKTPEAGLENGGEDAPSLDSEDPEIDDLGAELNPKKEAHNSPEANQVSITVLGNGKEDDGVTKTPEAGLENGGEDAPSLDSEGISQLEGVCASNDQSVYVSGICDKLGEEAMDIDESNPGESWLQGLMEADYSDLSVEERLNALVALIGVAIEGNSIRVVLEERLEATNALKKQMWAEAQLDKRRMKEEYIMKMHFPPFLGNKMEHSHALSAAESKQSLLMTTDDKSNEMSVKVSVQKEEPCDMQNDLNYINNLPSEINLQMQDLSAGPEHAPYQHPGLVAERSRSKLKSLVGQKAEEMYVYRSLPLGQDRRRNRYWQFIASASHNDPGSGRIFVELHDGRWRLIDSEEVFDALLASLDVRGFREFHLQTMLQKIEMTFKETVRKNRVGLNMHQQRRFSDSVKTEAPVMVAGPDSSSAIDSPSSIICVSVKVEAPVMVAGPDFSSAIDSPSSSICVADAGASETSTSFAIETGRNESERSLAVKRYLDFEKWMWKESSNSLILCASKYGKKRCRELLSVCDDCQDIYFYEDNHCSSCHKTYGASMGALSFSEHVAYCEQKLKRDPDYTFCGLTSPLRIRLLKWQLALIEVSCLPEALNPVWTNNYRKSWGLKLQSSSSAEDLLQVLTLLESGIKRDYMSSNYETASELLGFSGSLESKETASTLPWLPRTTAALALRLMEFDASISYMVNQKIESQKDKSAGDSFYAVTKNNHHAEASDTPHQTGLLQENNGVEVGIESSAVCQGRARGNRGRAQGRIRGGKSRKRVSSMIESGKRSTTTNTDRLSQVLTWKGKSRGRSGRKRGRHSVRSRQKPVKRAAEVDPKEALPKESLYANSSLGLMRGEWSGDPSRFLAEPAARASSSERSEFEDENGQGTGDEYDNSVVDGYAGGFSGKSNDMLEGSDYNNIEDDYDDVDNEEADMDAEEYMNEESDIDETRHGHGEPIEEPDDGTGSSSSDYSD